MSYVSVFPPTIFSWWPLPLPPSMPLPVAKPIRRQKPGSSWRWHLIAQPPKWDHTCDHSECDRDTKLRIQLQQQQQQRDIIFLTIIGCKISWTSKGPFHPFLWQSPFQMGEEILPFKHPKVTLQWDNIISHHGISPFSLWTKQCLNLLISPSQKHKIQTKKPTKPQQKQIPS